METTTWTAIFEARGHIHDNDDMGAEMMRFVDKRDPVRLEQLGWSLYDRAVCDSYGLPDPTAAGYACPLITVELQPLEKLAKDYKLKDPVAVRMDIGYFHDSVLDGRHYWLDYSAWNKLMEQMSRSYEAKRYGLRPPKAHREQATAQARKAASGETEQSIDEVAFHYALPPILLGQHKRDPEIIAKVAELIERGFSLEKPKCTDKFCGCSKSKQFRRI